MENIYYEPGPKRAERVDSLFSRIARRYDVVNDLQSVGMHRVWKRRCVEVANPRPGDRILDLCCGTGDLAYSFESFINGIEVVAVDFNAAMLAAAGRKGRTTRVQLAQGDALKLPFRNSTFDVVTIGFGLRNLADCRQGLLEILRISRPGGRVVILDFGRPENLFWRGCFFAYLRIAVPVFGKIFCGDAQAYSYILRSLREYPAQYGVDRMLKELGAEQAGILRFVGGAMTINHARKPATSLHR